MTSPPPPRPPLDQDRLSSLPVGQVPWVVEVLDEVPSTNALVAERARAGAPEGLVVVAEHQTAGRGRLDRTWETPARAALTFSVLLRPGAEPARWPWLPLLTGLAVARGIPGDGRLKWPNDVLLGDRKVAGILLERVDTPTGPAGVVGIGLNVSATEAELPVPTATSLALEGHHPDRTDLLLDMLAHLDVLYADWLRGRPADHALQAAYTRACATLGREVRVDLPTGEALIGTAVEVDSSGRLVVDSGGSGRTAVGAGDVVHVRPVG